MNAFHEPYLSACPHLEFVPQAVAQIEPDAKGP